MSSHTNTASPYHLGSESDLLRLVPTPVPPDDAARERFAKRSAAGRIAESMANALGRGSAEVGTVRLATLLAVDAGALRIVPVEAARPESVSAKKDVVVLRSRTPELA